MKVSWYSNHFVVRILKAHFLTENNVYERSKASKKAKKIYECEQTSIFSVILEVTVLKCGLLMTDKISVW